MSTLAYLAYISTPPPTPHQIAIAHLASGLYPPRNAKPIDVDNWFNKNAKYHHALLRLVTREGLLGCEPSSYEQLLDRVQEITELGKPVGSQSCSRLHLAPLKTLTAMVSVLRPQINLLVPTLLPGGKPETWSDLQLAFESMEHVPDVYYEREDEGPRITNRISYTSPLGIFLRKVYLGYKTLTFQQTDTLREQVLDWCIPSRLVPPRNVEVGATGKGGIVSGLENGRDEPSQHVARLSSGSATMSMDVSVSMDFSRSQEESMDVTGQPSIREIPRNGDSSAVGTLHDAIRRKQVGTAGCAPNKRRKIVNKSTELDDTLDARVQMFKDYQSACARGDYSLALHSLDRFYNYRFPGYDKKMHQHALLSLASFHYNTGGLETARHVLHEAIKVARIEGDKACILHCVGLSRRIEAETSVPVSSVLVEGMAPHVADVGPDDDDSVPPLDELWNIKRRLDLGEALPTAYSRIWRAVARQEVIEKTRRRSKGPSSSNQAQKKEAEAEGVQIPDTLLADRATIHRVQASLWQMFGSSLLGDLHETLSTRKTPSQGTLLKKRMAFAQQLVRKSKYNDAMAAILESALDSDFTISDYHLWVHEVWSLLELIIRRSGLRVLDHVLQHFALPPAAFRQLGAGGPLRMVVDPTQKRFFDAFSRDEQARDRRTTDKMRANISTAEDAIDGESPIAALPPLLGTIHTAEQLGLWDIHRQCCVKLSSTLLQIDRNVQPNLADPSRGRSEGQDFLLTAATHDIEPIWDKILAFGDDEQTFAGAYVLGCGQLKREPKQGLEFGRIAMVHALRLRNTAKMISAAKLSAIASHNTGNTFERNTFAGLWQKLSMAQNIDDWLRHDVIDPINAVVQDYMTDGDGLGSIWHWKKEYETLQQTVSLLPEIIARAGVDLTTR